MVEPSAEQTVFSEFIELLAHQQPDAGICFFPEIKQSIRTNQTVQQEIAACYMAKK